MSYFLEVEKERSFALVGFRGVVTAAEIAAALHNLLAHPDFGPDFGQLVDFSDFERFDVTGADVRELLRLSESAAPRSGRARIAFLASSDAVYGMTRMFQILGGELPYEIGTFRERAGAGAWLGLEVASARGR